MLKDERQRIILDVLRAEGRLIASDLAQKLSVSEDTVRRDLRDLAESGKIERVHGGALARAPGPIEYSERLLRHPGEKEELARATVNRIQDGMMIFLGSGTTTLQIARLLPTSLKITVITNSLPHAMALADHPLAEIILLGGKVAKTARATVGIATLEEIKRFRADLCILSICAIHAEEGLCDLEFDEARCKAAMLERSERRIALADPEKLGTVSAYSVGKLDLIDTLITGKAAPNELVEPFRAQGLEVVLA